MGEEHDEGGLRWQVVWPTRILRGQGSDENNASLVLDVRTATGLRAVLTGDIEPAAQRALGTTLAGPVDVLKVPHHGSPHQHMPLLTGGRPRVAIVSVGVGNDYGHPAPETLDGLARAGAVLLRTDADGDVAVGGTPDALTVVRRGR